MKETRTSKTDLIRFKYFLSSVSNEYSEQYFQGHQSALKKHNITGLKIPNDFDTNDSIILSVHDAMDDVVVGGARIKIRSNEHPLPIEKTQIRHVEIFSSRVNQLMSQGLSVVEICGLWAHHQNRSHLKSICFGSELSFQSLRLSLDLGYQVITAIVPPHTLVHTNKIGFIADELIHQIPYPDDRYLSTVIWYFNPQKTINTALLNKLNNKEVIEHGL